MAELLQVRYVDQQPLVFLAFSEITPLQEDPKQQMNSIKDPKEDSIRNL